MCIYREMYCGELAHVIREAEKFQAKVCSANWILRTAGGLNSSSRAGSLETQEEPILYLSPEAGRD